MDCGILVGCGLWGNWLGCFGNRCGRIDSRGVWPVQTEAPDKIPPAHGTTPAGATTIYVLALQVEVDRLLNVGVRVELFLCIGHDELWLALPLVLSFSAGLAGVLVHIGILVVNARNFATSRWGEGRLHAFCRF